MAATVKDVTSVRSLVDAAIGMGPGLHWAHRLFMPLCLGWIAGRVSHMQLDALYLLLTYAGACMNAIAVTHNQGLMPVMVRKGYLIETPGIPLRSGRHQWAHTGMRFPWLIDWIDTPIGVASIGDVLLVIGVIIGTVRVFLLWS